MNEYSATQAVLLGTGSASHSVMRLLAALEVSLLSRPTGSDTQQKETNLPAL
jgi:hypothetical protein